MEPGEPIEHALVTKAIENAQRKLEGHHFDIRKQLLGYDNVANDQRKVIYSQRATVMTMENPHIAIESMAADVLENIVNTHIPVQSLEDQWDVAGLTQLLAEEFRITAPIQQWCDEDHAIQTEQIKEQLSQLFQECFEYKESLLGTPMFHSFEKTIILQSLDNHWREHLAAMDHLRQGIHLRGYAQKDPKQEYKRESFELFTSMLDTLKYEIVKLITSVEINTKDDLQQVEEQRRADAEVKLNLIHGDNPEEDINDAPVTTLTYRNEEKKIGRNDACFCQSGKKYKQCHGRLV
jgi:preprotein translocase subunit SecA